MSDKAPTVEELRERLITRGGVLPGDAGAMAAVLYEATGSVRLVLHEVERHQSMVEHHKNMVEIYRKEAMFAAKAAYAAVLVAGLVAMFAFFGWLANRGAERGAERAQRAAVQDATERMAETLAGIERRLIQLEAKP